MALAYKLLTGVQGEPKRQRVTTQIHPLRTGNPFAPLALRSGSATPEADEKSDDRTRTRTQKPELEVAGGVQA